MNPNEKSDWFDQHIDDPIERQIARKTYKLIKEIEYQHGMIYHSTFLEFANKFVNYNFKNTWNHESKAKQQTQKK